MRKALAGILAVCLMLALAPASPAEESVTEYKSEYYTVTLPGQPWYEEPEENGFTYFYADLQDKLGKGMLMFLEQEIDLGDLVMDETVLNTLYDAVVSSADDTAVEGSIVQEDTKIAGRFARFFTYDEDFDGVIVSVVGSTVLIDGHLLVFCYSLPGKTTTETMVKVLAMAASVKYAGDSGAAPDTATPL